MEIEKAIALARENNQKAFNFLLHEFWNNVYAFQLNRTQNETEAEDITIRTFSRAFDKIDTYNTKYTFSTWLITISKNIHIDLLRKESRTISSGFPNTDDMIFDIIDESPTAEDNLIIEQNLAKLLRDIKKLKPHYQEVINLRYFQELSYNEISKKLDLPINNVKIKLLRAKKMLAEIINSHKDENL